MELLKNRKIRQRLAKALVLSCFRNTFLEELHCGTTPSSKAGDYSDVKVVSPYGELSWVEIEGRKKVSRISDEEMKILMKEAVNNMYTMLTNLSYENYQKKIEFGLKRTDVCPEWDSPKLNK